MSWPTFLGWWVIKFKNRSFYNFFINFLCISLKNPGFMTSKNPGLDLPGKECDVMDVMRGSWVFFPCIFQHWTFVVPPSTAGKATCSCLNIHQLKQDCLSFEIFIITWSEYSRCGNCKSVRKTSPEGFSWKSFGIYTEFWKWPWYIRDMFSRNYYSPHHMQK